jgi:arabinogalactan oligomer/maltooligosaccharide transport system substrate-binding protein
MLRHGGLAVNPLIHPWFRHLRPWVGVAIAPILMGLSGCRPKDWVHGLPQNDALRGQIFVLVGLSPDERFDSHTRKDAERRLAILLEGFQSIHPQVRVQVQTLPASDLIDVLSRRNRAGLSPDVVIVRGEAAMALQQKHLIQPQAYPPGQLAHLDRSALHQLHLGDGRYLGLPIGLFPQVACYNRERLPTPPTTIKALLDSATQVRIGLPMQFTELSWTLGSLGALDSVMAIASGQPPTATLRQPIAAWLSWLRSPELQQRTVFQASQDGLLGEMGAGRLDWMPCRGYEFDRLRRQLGPALAVAHLPAGPGGPASPYTIKRVIALGVNSSPNQRRIAQAFLSFGINPVSQRALALRSQQELSVLTNLNLDASPSPVVGALMASNLQSGTNRQLNQKIVNADLRSDGQLQSVLNRFLYGEIETPKATDALIEMLRPVASQLP